MGQVSHFFQSPWESIQNMWNPTVQNSKATGQISPQPIGMPPLTAPKSGPSVTALHSVYQSLLNASPRSEHSNFNFVESHSDSSAPRLNLPQRPANAPSGSEFLASVASLSRPEREEAIQKQILSGNVPEHLRELKAIELQAQGSQGEKLQATAYVTPDYLAIGSADDYALVPMSPITAQAIADATQTTLPTRKLVDKIYQQAEVQLSPSPQKPGPQMMSTPYYQRHDNTIKQQRIQAGAQAGELIAGHKKDVVITNRLDHKPQSVAIYGWHQRNGKNIQALSTLHVNTYADYSHGVRLVGPTVTINGESHPTQEVLRHPEWASLLSDEGVIRNPRATR